MRRMILCFILISVSMMALVTFAQDDDHDEASCDVDSLQTHVEEEQAALNDLLLDDVEDVDAILENIYNIGHSLQTLAGDCGFVAEMDHDETEADHDEAATDPHSIGDPENGEVLFSTMIPEVGFACATCHRVDSTETLIGPGLLTVGDPDHDPNAHAADDDMDMGDDTDDMDMDSDDDHDDDTDDMDMDSDDDHDDDADDMDMGGMNMDPVSYIYTSITDPGAFVVDGFVDNLMPQTYSEVFTEEEINDIIAYLISLSTGVEEEHDD